MVNDDDYGFTWGQMVVHRLTSYVSHKGRAPGLVLGVDTDHHKVQVYASPTGRVVRVWRDGKELS